MNENNEKFKYSYSAPTELERREIESIKKQYDLPDLKNAKLGRLRRLDSFVRSSATAVGISVGVVGMLLFGLGMAMVLEWKIYLWGVLVALVGLVPMLTAFPLYKATLKINKKKYGKEILSLSKELLSENED